MILQENSAARNRGITLASIKGIIGNVVLVIFKMIVGLASNSIAIILDAVNNLTDVLSSVLTIVGTKLAAKGADKEHPFGHGRIEYMTTMAIASSSLVQVLDPSRNLLKKFFTLRYLPLMFQAWHYRCCYCGESGNGPLY